MDCGRRVLFKLTGVFQAEIEKTTVCEQERLIYTPAPHNMGGLASMLAWTESTFTALLLHSAIALFEGMNLFS